MSVFRFQANLKPLPSSVLPETGSVAGTGAGQEDPDPSPVNFVSQLKKTQKPDKSVQQGQIDRQTDRQIDRQIDRQKDRWKERQLEIVREEER